MRYTFSYIAKNTRYLAAVGMTPYNVTHKLLYHEIYGIG